MNKKVDAMLIEAAIATGPRTNSYKIIDYMKSKRFYNIPMPGHVGRRIQVLGVAKKTGRRLRFDGSRSSTITEYEVLV
ncbi:MAG: hypothetical protein A4E31_00843 [Methanomassiliicoccales archaeon PtaU1.Bin030]|jgi:hypothetical protein|nr:MAG: hypothetical protein A4E31_00843 [Methanomassiliicoccales archaeon PtaU1.Bin030]